MLLQLTTAVGALTGTVVSLCADGFGVAVACCSKYRSARLSAAAPSACGTNSPLSPRFSSSRSAWTRTISSTLTLLNNRTLTLNTLSTCPRSKVSDRFQILQQAECEKELNSTLTLNQSFPP
ncbi:hypothetical protein J6590_033891 [Homalodisca vitripennis]|nr:hypothetical protein J6590_033891 [Homalodisca vitripennis]